MKKNEVWKETKHNGELDTSKKIQKKDKVIQDKLIRKKNEYSPKVLKEK